ncbi:MAG: hypothetical protein A2857_06500 [Candidatus Levybacteria bacterium RIFCSPHIGHO2_01_FULL_36_15]|nr:MAG: hypothetical protein A2857_06500 [Candidatus Levybacteria bacterium RIFCSPHIGHO2_01_FULL_36_15]OGH38828.1 MAG: hypothetical protein A2905_02615 [Candidatus Levybacteria bacterium RIFCSPLOWO2_01_FULL_36_10]
MQSLILLGAEEERNEYVQNFIKDKKVKSFNVLKFDKKIKISDVRIIKKILAIKEAVTEKRLVVLSEDMTIEAQNALLKTLEELPENTDVIILCSNKENLLPTIISRSFIVNLKVSGISKEEHYGHDDAFLKLIGAKKEEMIYFAMLLSEKISASPNDKELENFILTLRKLLFKEISGNKNEDNIFAIYNLLSATCAIYPYVLNNNLNKKIVLEKIFLECLIRGTESRSGFI